MHDAVKIILVAVGFTCLDANSSAYATQAGGAPELRVHQFSEPTLDPAGHRLAAIEGEATRDSPPHARGSIVLRSVPDGAVIERLDPCPNCEYTSLAWSPNGDQLAFLASDERAHTVTLDVVSNGRTRALHIVHGIATSLRWSPDGKRLALLVTEDARKKNGATEAGIPLVGEIATTEDERRIGVVGLNDASYRLISPPDLFVYEYDWTPDARAFVATAAAGNGDNNWWLARLLAVDSERGAVREITAPTVQMRYPHISPDGKTITFVGGLMSDFASSGGDIYAVPFSGGEATNLTPSFAGTFRASQWSKDTLYATVQIKDRYAIATVMLPTGKVSIWWSGPISLASPSGDADFTMSRDGAVLAALAEDFERAPRIVSGSKDHLIAITHDNDGLPAIASASSIEWKSDGQDVQGWLLKPRQTAQEAPHRLVIAVHGGPGAAATPAYLWRGVVFELLSHGYYILEPNPRGSFGQGERFTRGNVRDLGGGDLRDVLVGLDTVEHLESIDDHHVGILGGSYGGFLTMHAITQSHRFRAAVAGAGIANLVSYYGQNGIDQWMIPFFGASAYDAPERYFAASPISRIKAARTPTLLYVGERDLECPAAQSIEFWHGLRAMNVPTSLVIYEGEGHVLAAPEHIQDATQRTLAWFDRYL